MKMDSYGCLEAPEMLNHSIMPSHFRNKSTDTPQGNLA